MTQQKKILIVIGCIFLLLCGCGKEEEYPDDQQANHGPWAIMETENGYYYNHGYTIYEYNEETKEGRSYERQMLRYYDKESGETILLCNKPECEHNGDDTCTATFKNMTVINSVLYGDWIYIYGVTEEDNRIQFNLYRVALDGTSMDKVGTAFETENTIGAAYSISYVGDMQNDSGFVIHRGYAYLPYYLRIGKTTKGFMGGGLMQINLKTGETKAVYTMDSMTGAYPLNLRGCGDYVYMDLKGTNSDKGTMRYVVSENVLEYLPADENLKYHRYYQIVTEERLYNVFPSFEETEQGYQAVSPYRVEASDGMTGEYLETECFDTDVTLEEGRNMLQVYTYENLLVIVTTERVVFYGISQENYGCKLGEIGYEFEGAKLGYEHQRNIFFKITDGTLYCICRDYMGRMGNTFDGMGYFDLAEVTKCSIEDILSGKGSWEKAFTYGTGRER